MSDQTEQPVVSRIRVRYAETDQMGVAYHANYLVWCEIGRTDLIRTLGMTYAEIEAKGIFLAVAEARVRYRQSARYDDMVRIETSIARVQSRSITFEYKLMREEPVPSILLATATTQLVSIDANGSLKSLPPNVLEKFRATPHS